MSLVDPTVKSFPDLPHTPANDQRYDAIMVVANQNETSHIGLIMNNLHHKKCTHSRPKHDQFYWCLYVTLV